MNEMSKQMELFDEGGLMQEGGTVDPVSGNDVPVGSTQEEVRDDIPAQLSEGEFVMPADVVRYHGLDKMMALRDEAKMGLQRMDDMGQMGNSEEAIIPDGVPFGMDDLEMEDDGLEMAQGGLVNMSNGGMIGQLTTGFPASSGALGTPVGQIGTFNPNNPLPGALAAPMGQGGRNIQASPQVVVYGPDGTAYANPAAAQAAGVTNYTMTKPISTPTGQAAAPMQAASAQFQPLGGTKFTPTTSTPQQAMPTFKETIGMGVPYVDYDPDAPDGTEQPETPTEVAPPATGQSGDGDIGRDGGDNQDFGGGTSLITGEKIAGYSPEEIKSGVTSAKDRYAVTGNRGIDLLNFLPGGQLLKGLLGTDDKPSTGLFSNTPEAMPTGFTDSDGNIIPSASVDYMKNLGGLPSTDTMTETTRTSGSPLPNMNVLPASAPTVRNLQNLRGMLGVSPTRYVGFNKGDLDPNSGGFFNKDGVAIDPETGGAAKNESGTMNYASFEDFKNAIAAGNESGWRGGVISSKQYNGLSAKGKANYDKFADITKNRKGGGLSVKEIAKEAKAKADKAAAEQAAAEAKASRDRLAQIQQQQYSDSGGDNADSYGGSGVESGGRGEGFGDFSSGLSHAKGGLVSQMKRSGLASKK